MGANMHNSNAKLSCDQDAGLSRPLSDTQLCRSKTYQNLGEMNSFPTAMDFWDGVPKSQSRMEFFLVGGLNPSEKYESQLG